MQPKPKPVTGQRHKFFDVVFILLFGGCDGRDVS